MHRPSARVSSLLTLLSFLKPFLPLRYYEWQKKPPTKIAHFTRLPLTPKQTNASPPLMFFAGLWDSVTYQSPVESRFKPSDDPEDTREPYPTGNPLPLATFTILTTDPAKDIRWLHDRMPCILSGWEDVSRWLDLGEVKGWEDGKGGTGDLLRGTAGLDWWGCSLLLLVHVPDEPFHKSFPVPPEVGKIGKNSPTFIQPVSERSDGIKSFFQKQQPSPAKKADKSSSPTKPEPDAEPDDNEDISIAGDKKEKVEDLDTKGDKEKGLGDDSNAPNPEPIADVKPSGRSDRNAKRKREVGEDEGEAESKAENNPERRAGHQTKVIRRVPSDDTNKAVSLQMLPSLGVIDCTISNLRSRASSRHQRR